VSPAVGIIVSDNAGKGPLPLPEFLKLVATLLVGLVSGGAAGAVLTEWYLRKRGRLQKIPLIERVNRQVSPRLQGGITLARNVGDPTHPQLVELRNLREYQLTLRNTSTVHLQNVEIQFEFPAADVQEYASPRTAVSKTALLKLDTVPTDARAYPTVFRWRIPHLPSGDSVEFTFQAVDPPSESYEVALYNSDRVIVERVDGEPAPARNSKVWQVVALVGFIGAGSGFGALLTEAVRFRQADKLTAVKEAGCDLRVLTSYNRFQPGSDIRVIQNRIFNLGQSCVVQSDQIDPKGPFTIGAGDTVTRERLAQSRPKLVQTEVSVGATGAPLKKTVIPLYAEP
jgi:hypothetical protein